jgi:hydroxyacid-oxoacid transhydrogenase
VSNTKREDAGLLLADTLRQFLYDLKVEDGLSAVGYTKDDIPDLVRGTIPQVTTH